MIFSKNGITSGVRKQIENDSNYSIITLEDLFKKNTLGNTLAKNTAAECANGLKGRIADFYLLWIFVHFLN